MGYRPIFYGALNGSVCYVLDIGSMNKTGATVTGLTDLLEPAIENMGYELVHLEIAGRGSSAVLRIYIDAPGGIQLDDCESVSRHVSALLDVEDPLAGSYVLEVSSPGLDRPLVKPVHFQQFLGDRARIIMATHILGRRRFTGQMVHADDETVVVEVDGESYELPYKDIESARLEPLY